MVGDAGIAKLWPKVVSARTGFNWQLDLCCLIDEIARIQRTIADQRMAKNGLTHIQYIALLYVHYHEGMTQTDLQNLLEITRGACTQLVDRLARADLLERRPDPDDRRVNRLFVTPAAEKVIGASRAISEKILGHMFQDISKADGEHMIELLNLCKKKLSAVSGRIQGD